MATEKQLKFINDLAHLAPARVDGAKISWGDDLAEMPYGEVKILIDDLLNIYKDKQSSQPDPRQEVTPEQIKNAKALGAIEETLRCVKVIQKFCFQTHQSQTCDCGEIINAIKKGKTNE